MLFCIFRNNSGRLSNAEMAGCLFGRGGISVTSLESKLGINSEYFVGSDSK